MGNWKLGNQGQARFAFSLPPSPPFVKTWGKSPGKKFQRDSRTGEEIPVLSASSWLFPFSGSSFGLASRTLFFPSSLPLSSFLLFLSFFLPSFSFLLPSRFSTSPVRSSSKLPGTLPVLLNQFGTQPLKEFSTPPPESSSTSFPSPFFFPLGSQRAGATGGEPALHVKSTSARRVADVPV